MDLKQITSQDKKQYNQLVSHVIQSWEWGEFRQRLGLTVLRYGIFDHRKLQTAFQLDLHQIPYLQQNIGYLPKGPFPNQQLALALRQIGQQYSCAAIKVEPMALKNEVHGKIDKSFHPSSKPYFTKNNYLIDLKLSEEQLLIKMHAKTRYNIKVAKKHKVWVEERDDPAALEIHLKLYFETTHRQGYLGHNETYHRLCWETLAKAGMAKILIAFYQPNKLLPPIPLASWMLLNFQDTLYYPYGGSSAEYKHVMAPTLLAWEAIRYGKKMKLKTFDLWGAAPPDAPPNDPWFGFTRFKANLGANLVEYIGSFDLVFNQPVYQAFTLIDRATKLKSLLLKITGK
ncbi:peptidoglycan bridge formation glycyltransferase FemA/FemB family protein [Patescibacteria group bacterium]|nr:peptidoglycan bridge formation glycyltransferase FemA/FemB family protein [Patescibacteria group bacterium]MCL5410073.1 peptidoglycan bridge formation glycyltransferase FemA/FemB family protein [Patescibacteria group bacterium]